MQQPRHEVEWAKDTTAEASFLVEEQGLSFLFNDHDIFATTSSMDPDPLSISSYYTHSSAPYHGHVPFFSASSTMHPLTHSYEPLSRGLQMGHVIEFSQKGDDGAKVIDKWALDDPLDNTAELLRTLKQMPDNEEGSRLPWCLSTGQGPLHRYVGSSFWALSGTGVSSHLILPRCIKYVRCEEPARMVSMIWQVQKEQMADIEADT